MNAKSLSYENIETFFPTNSEAVFKYLSGTEDIKDKRNKIKPKTFIHKARDLYNKKKDIAKTLRDRDSVFGKLDLVFAILIAYGALIILLLMFKAEYKLFMTSFGTSLITFSWIFADSIKAIYNCFIFLFIIRPYDIGDKVKVDGEQLIVHKVDLLTTTFLTLYNKIVYFPNEQLIHMKIYNIARSSPQHSVLE